MKFIKHIRFNWRNWFYMCGLSAVFSVMIELRAGIIYENMALSLYDSFVWLFVFNIFNSSLGWLHGKIGKIRYYIVIMGIAFGILFIQRTLIDFVRKDAINWRINLIVIAIAIPIAVIGLALYEWIMYIRNKNMNRKLKEYQEKNKDKD